MGEIGFVIVQRRKLNKLDFNWISLFHCENLSLIYFLFSVFPILSPNSLLDSSQGLSKNVQSKLEALNVCGIIKVAMKYFTFRVADTFTGALSSGETIPYVKVINFPRILAISERMSEINDVLNKVVNRHCFHVSFGPGLKKIFRIQA